MIKSILLVPAIVQIQALLTLSVLVGLLVPDDLWHKQACREQKNPAIASFDADVDQVTHLTQESRLQSGKTRMNSGVLPEKLRNMS